MPDMPEEMPEPASERTEYPGVEFMPPKGMDTSAKEGEALVKWKKVGDKFTMVEFDGEPLVPATENEEGPATMDDMRGELEMMDKGGE